MIAEAITFYLFRIFNGRHMADSFSSNREVKELARQLEMHLKQGISFYCDPPDLIKIIEYYQREGKAHKALDAVEFGLDRFPHSSRFPQRFSDRQYQIRYSS